MYLPAQRPAEKARAAYSKGCRAESWPREFGAGALGRARRPSLHNLLSLSAGGEIAVANELKRQSDRLTGEVKNAFYVIGLRKQVEQVGPLDLESQA
jgi:hypothetical protein